MNHDTFPQVSLNSLGLLTVISPTLLATSLGLKSLFGIRMSESTMNFFTFSTTSVGLLSTFGVFISFIISGQNSATIDLGNWMALPYEHFHFQFILIFDRLSLPFTICIFTLCGIVSAFSSRYLHRDPGFSRYYVCYSFFTLGMVLSSLAGTIEVLFVGWELVGLSSSLLIAFFHERRVTVKNSFRIWNVYRISDAAFLVAAIYLHHLIGEGDLIKITGEGIWPHGIAEVTSSQALSVGILLLCAAAGKSGLIPFSGWLPRAMEGPTPSSAIFYGALSIHLGCYLLLRISPILAASKILSMLVICIGILTALLAVICARVQNDIKSALAFASLTQVGIIVAEIGFGLNYAALVHIIGHAFMRTLQLLRAPNLISDYHTIENAIGGRPSHSKSILSKVIPLALSETIYRVAFNRGYLDMMLDHLIVKPFLYLFKLFTRWETSWENWIIGKKYMKNLNNRNSSSIQ